MRKSYLAPEKRLDKVPQYLKEDLTFDIVNAFGLVKNPIEAALLLQDLLTKKELDNLAKRLGVAKLLLAGKKQEEIIEQLHCGFGIIARVQMWLREGGEGLRNIIMRLPKRKQYSQRKFHVLPAQYRMPQLVMEYIQYLQANHEEKQIKKFLENVDDKAVLDKSLREALNEYYRDQYANRKKVKNL